MRRPAKRMTEYRVLLSNGENLKIIAQSPQKAYARATKWCKNGVTIKFIVEVEN